MQSFKIHRGDTGLFKGHQLNLVYDQEMFLPFLTHTCSEEHIIKHIDQRSGFSTEMRSVLSDRLRSQYDGLLMNELVEKNIELLRNERTYTITTGHQLCLYTGPLYFVIKVLHAIKMCKQIGERYPDYNFVPIYWMATEDHDFEEIASTNLFGKELEWKTDQNGPVGRFNTRGLEAVKVQLHQLFENSEDEIHEVIDQLDGESYGGAFRRLINHLFGEYGLVIIDGDDRELKRQFASEMEAELKDQFSFEQISITNKELEKNGGIVQVNPRDVNLFYIKDGIRSRVVREGHQFEIDQVGQFSTLELIQMVHEEPESFSPNVVLRPLYQETILPNLAYIGGGGEISYWLQLKRMFDYRNVPFPILCIRNSVLWIDRNISDKLTKFDLQLEDIFKSVDELKSDYVRDQEVGVLDFDRVQASKEALLQDLDELIHEVDPSLERYALGEATKLDKQIAGIQSKLIKVSKKKHEDAMKSIELINAKLFPNNGLQERHTNFLQFCVKGNVKERLSSLYGILDPFEKDLIIIREV